MTIVFVSRDAQGNIDGVYAYFCAGIAEEEIESDNAEVVAFLNPPPPPYTIGADVPWSRMTDDEAELVQDEIDASPVKTRNMINKATSFTQGADAFNKFKAIITAALDAARAEAIMGPLLPSESATIGDEAA